MNRLLEWILRAVSVCFNWSGGSQGRHLRLVHDALHGGSRIALRSSCDHGSWQTNRARNPERIAGHGGRAGSASIYRNLEFEAVLKAFLNWTVLKSFRWGMVLQLIHSNASGRFPRYLQRFPQQALMFEAPSYATQSGKLIHQTHRQRVKGIMMRFVLISALKDLRRMRRDPMALIAWSAGRC